MREMAESPIQLIIRFPTSTPDFPLLVSSPQTTTTLALKQQIRPHLPSSTSSNRLRLIHSGKVLPDTALLSLALSVPPPPPRGKLDVSADKPSPPGSFVGEKSVKSKGKEPLKDDDGADEDKVENKSIVPRIYIHCSIGDALSASELEAEAHAARSSIQAPSTPIPHHAASSPSQSFPQVLTSALPPALPLGFDRLLSANFSREDVASLRAQFLALQQHTHTPDTMPRGQELRLLEDRWLDSEAFGPPMAAGEVEQNRAAVVGGEGGGATAVAEGGGILPVRNTTGTWGLGGGAGFGEDSGLEDMLIGNLMGFFWPLGALCWLLREEGVWTQRRQIAVFTGMVVNAAFGFWRMAG